MRILLAIVHHWNPDGDGRHQSLRPNPQPRLDALQAQLLSLRRLGLRQGHLNIASMQVCAANERLLHEIDIVLVHDGSNHVLQFLDPVFLDGVKQVVVDIDNPRMLGFAAQRALADQLDKNYDLYGYLEDDLVINDPLFFHKISWFTNETSPAHVLLPQRYEFASGPHMVDRFYIDGPLHPQDLESVIPEPVLPIQTKQPGGPLLLESPTNPHSGCFVLTHQQLSHWVEQPFWQDGDVSFVGPLESAATLGIAKAFSLYKPCFANASWLEIQHWGRGFHCLIGNTINSGSLAA